MNTLSQTSLLFDEPNHVVNEALEGLVRCNPNLALLDTGRVVVQRNYLSVNHVKILSGSDSGHEPSFAGFIGNGMLTASVQGDIHKAPSPHVILQAIKELARRNEHGVFIIIGNNPANKLHFLLAMERAQNIPNVKVKMIIIENDKRNLPFNSVSCGTVLIQKIAGAMAEEGSNLFEIQNYCMSLKHNISSSSICTRHKDDDGRVKVNMKVVRRNVHSLFSDIIKKYDELHFGHSSVSVIVLINNFGYSTKLEEHILLNTIISEVTNELKLLQLFYGTFISERKISGFSVTILKVTDADILKYLNSPCDAPYWSNVKHVPLELPCSAYLSTKLESYELTSKTNKGPRINMTLAKTLEKCFKFACDAIVACEQQLNIMDSEYGDSDTGTNVKKGVSVILSYIKRNKDAIFWPHTLFMQISYLLEMNCNRFLCTIYSLMSASAATPFLSMNEFEDVTPLTWLKCLEHMCSSLQNYEQASGEETHTYVTLRGYFDMLQSNIERNSMEFLEAVAAATKHAEDIVTRTKLHNHKYPDPGAYVVGIWLRAIYEVLKLNFTQ